MSDIEETLQERGARYGEFHYQAEIAQGLKLVMQATGNWKRLSADKRKWYKEPSALYVDEILKHCNETIDTDFTKTPKSLYKAIVDYAL